MLSAGGIPVFAEFPHVLIEISKEAISVGGWAWSATNPVHLE
jgi:hypothetical protein